MKVAVLSDIHANIAALERVLAEVRQEGIEHLVVLGDLVGYYYEPKAVFAALRKFNCTVIQGNHDRMALQARSDPELRNKYRSQYGSGLDAVLEQFGEDEWAWLTQLSPKREIKLGKFRILLVHGAPFDPDATIYPDASASRFARVAGGFDGDAVWLGHTHWPFLHAGSPAIMNPGSVGQPRDTGGLASWAVFYADTGAVAFRRTEFPVGSTLAQCRQKDRALSSLAEVLTRRRIEQAA